MSNTINGYILIADISGYTMFLNQSELEHAQEILQSLLKVMIEHTKLPLVISRLEGDSVISYVQEGGFLQSSTVIEMIESCYVAFRRAIQLMVINTTCKCNACKNMTNLDLKFFLHYGTFGLQPMPTYTELIGNDVNLVHRLTKNHVTEKTGLRAYGLLTQAAVESLNLQNMAQEMHHITENYDLIGDVEAFVLELSPVWQREQERTRLVVKPEEAMMIMEFDFPVSPVHLWDYLIKPEYRAVFLGAKSAEAQNLQNGRIGEGTIYQCAHGNTITPLAIVDWQPFDTHTFLDESTPIAPLYSTYRLSPTQGGTRLTILQGSVKDLKPFKRIVMKIMMRIFTILFMPKMVENLRSRMAQDLADGTLHDLEAVEVNMEEIASSIRNAIRGEGISS